jgi:putative hydrolase of the HAD superfamily
MMIRAVLFDFGGVIAEEGFWKGLRTIAGENNVDPDTFFRTAEDLIHQTGYVTGKVSERQYWKALRDATGITREDQYLREHILSEFVLRPDMLAHVDRLRAAGKIVCILSDQTDWLDELNGRNPFFHRFSRIFNSYHIGKSKRDPSIFTDACAVLRVDAAETLFVDDNGGNVTRAKEAGLRAVRFTTVSDFEAAMTDLGIFTRE